jgi:hypothetical protein
LLLCLKSGMIFFFKQCSACSSYLVVAAKNKQKTMCANLNKQLTVLFHSDFLYFLSFVQILCISYSMSIHLVRFM